MFFVSALFMLIQIFLGHGLPLIVGPSTVILIGILSSPGAQPAALHTAILLGGLGLFILAWTGLLGKIRRLFTRRVVAVVLLLIAFTLTPTIIRLITGAGGRRDAPLERPVCLCPVPVDACPASVPGRNLALDTDPERHRCGNPRLARSWTGLRRSGVRRLRGPLRPVLHRLYNGAFLRPRALAAFFICFIALAINDIGSIESMNAFVDDGDKEGRLRRGIAVTGLANLAAGFLGVIGQVNYSLSPGVVASSRCLSRFALVPAALLMLAVAFSPAAIAVMEAVPSVVVGSAMLYILCAQMAAGIMVLMEDERGAGFNGGLVVGIPLLLAILVAFLPPPVVQSFPAPIRPVAGNSFVMGVLAVLFLEHVLFRAAGRNPEG